MSGNITIDTKNIALTTLNTYVWVSLHTAYSSIGANEVVDAFYARQQITYDVALGGILGNTTQAVFASGINATINYIGVWDAATLGNFLGMAPAQSGFPYVFMCNDTVNGVIYCQGHPFGEGSQMVLWNGGHNTLPTGFGELTIYQAKDVGGEYFSICDPAFPFSSIIPTVAGVGWAQEITPVELDGTSGLTVSNVQIDLSLF